MKFKYKGEIHHLKGFNVSDDGIKNMIKIPKKKYCDENCPRGEYGFSISNEDIEAKKADINDRIIFNSTDNSTSKKGENLEMAFVKATIWALSQTYVSINSLQKSGRIPNNHDVARQIYQKLCKYGILSDEKDSRGRLKVYPQSVEDILSELKEILSRNGISDADIVDAISKRDV